VEEEKIENVIIFGASGFVGSMIFEHLKEANTYEVFGYSSKDCDLLNPSHVAKALSIGTPKTSVVICSVIPPSIEDSWEVMLKNITMIHNVILSIPNNGLRSIILLSSIDIYGSIFPVTPIREDTVPRPDGFYGLSKLVCEHVLRFNKKIDFPVTCLRLPGIYGNGDGGRSIVGKFIQKLTKGEDIEIFGDGKVKRDYVEVGDLCAVVEQFIEKPYNGSINVATGKSVAIIDMVSVIADIIGTNASIKYSDKENKNNADIVLDTSLLKSLCPTLEFKSLEEGIRCYWGKN